MASYKYATAKQDNEARAIARSQNVSAKQCIEIARWLKGRPTKQASAMLEGVLNYTIAVPYRKFKKKMGHRKGPMGTGRYPQKASQLFLKMIKEVEANADVKGLDTSSLVLSAIVVNRAAGNMHQGRQRGREFKNIHIELVALATKKSTAAKKPAKKAEPVKVEAPLAKKVEPKTAPAAKLKAEESKVETAKKEPTPTKKETPVKTEAKEAEVETSAEVKSK